MEEKRNQEKISSTLSTFESMTGLHVETVSYVQIPDNVKKHFESNSAKFITPSDYTPENFQKLSYFKYQNGDICYLAEQDKTYDTNGDTERLTYFLETREGVEIGYLELRYNLTSNEPYFKNKPFVGFTRTYEDFQRQGLGERRLLTANAYCLERYNHPLNSDTPMDESAKKVWENLINKGIAERYLENNKERFRFLKNNA